MCISVCGKCASEAKCITLVYNIFIEMASKKKLVDAMEIEKKSK